MFLSKYALFTKRKTVYTTVVAYEKECSQGMHGQPCEYRVDDEGKKKVDRPTKCCMAY